ncbi:MAG TPA: DUF1028 domain-containing protein [Egibacteraceae bacterium]|nr:DUF1028 domain-containing protein [Egibacteraceae bacterium]
MTFSIVARCARTGQLGVGAVTGTPGVGQLVTWAEAGVGAVATQAWVNPYLGVDGLDLMGNGHPAERTLRAVVAMDDDRRLRQVGMVDAHGTSAAYTGERCERWAGHRSEQDVAVQGNLLEGPETLDACLEAYAGSPGSDLVDRLIGALIAGEKAGGDRRGARSASVLVVATERYPLWDLRIDDSDRPLEALTDLRDDIAETLLPQILRLPTRQDSQGGLHADDHAGLV